MYGKTIVYEVAAGTKISSEDGKMTHIVTDENTVIKGYKIYCTEPNYQRLKEACKDAPTR